jgi:hypothetical protein
MKSETTLITFVKKDFRLLIKPTLLFASIYSILSIVFVYVSHVLAKEIRTHSIYSILDFTIIILYLLGILYNQYLFQSKYGEMIDIPANTVNFFNFLCKLVKLFIIQLLIFFGVLALLFLTIFLFEIYDHSKPSIAGMLITLFAVLLVLSFIVYFLYWFVRLAFIKYILIYSRIHYSNKIIIQESKYLVKQNFRTIFILFIIFLVCLIPQMITNSHNHNALATNYFSTVPCYLVGLVSTFIFIVITVNSILEHKYFFLLEPKK